MKLISFVVKKMHGHIDVDLRFNNDMSIVIGGNGSGKTSALTLLANVLRVESSEILKTKFELVELRYEIVERKRHISYLLMISEIEKVMTIRLHRQSELVSQQKLALNIQTGFTQWLDPDDISMGGLLGSFIRQSKEPLSKSVSPIVDIDAKVTFVRLDRAISAIDSHGGISFEEPDSKRELLSRKHTKGRLRDPLEVVRDVTSSKYVSYRNKLEEIKATTYDQLFSIHFSDSDIAAESSARLDRLEKKLTDIEEKLVASESIIPSLQNFAEFQKYLINTKAINAEVQATKNARKSGRRTRLEEVLSAQLASRSKKIELLLKVFEIESNESADAFKSLSIYLKTLNDFLRDSEKQIYFSQEDNNLYYKRLESVETAHFESKDLTRLSSGEKQIIIMLTYLAFLAEPGSIFIVDEPELSLHLRWQRMLVNALEALRPLDCQIVLATHAPEIAGRAREKCMRLNHGKGT